MDKACWLDVCVSDRVAVRTVHGMVVEGVVRKIIDFGDFVVLVLDTPRGEMYIASSAIESITVVERREGG